MAEATEAFTARMEPAEAQMDVSPRAGARYRVNASVVSIRQSALANLQAGLRDFYSAYGAIDAERMLPFVATLAKLEAKPTLYDWMPIFPSPSPTA